MKDNGLKTNGISPKVIAAVIAAVVAYVLGQEVLELPSWATVAGQAVLIAVAAYSARPGDVTTNPAERSSWGSESGYGLVEMAFALLLIIIALVVLFHFL